MLVSLLLISLLVHANDGTEMACIDAHKKALSSCGAHEHAVSAEALSIVSLETRARVVQSEKSKLDGIFQSCKKLQEACALTCDEAIESATLDGEDIAAPLDHLSDCRQGQVVRHLEAMNRKIDQLNKIQSLRPEKRRAITSAGIR